MYNVFLFSKISPLVKSKIWGKEIFKYTTLNMGQVANPLFREVQVLYLYEENVM
jgi:hypothetical protein